MRWAQEQAVNFASCQWDVNENMLATFWPEEAPLCQQENLKTPISAISVINAN